MGNSHTFGAGMNYAATCDAGTQMGASLHPDCPRFGFGSLLTHLEKQQMMAQVFGRCISMGNLKDIPGSWLCLTQF